MPDAQAATEATSKTGSTAPVQSTNAADETTTATEVDYQLSPEKMMMDNLFILGMLFFIFYFILIRPQQKRLKLHKETMKSLSKGNKIMTSAGIIGTIHKFEGDDVVVVEVAQGVKIRMARSAISEILSDKSTAESANDN